MKNIHVLPTDKPSRLYYNNNDQELQFCEVFRKSTPLKENKNIYITSDEEIKEGDYYLYGIEIIQANGLVAFHPTIINACKKIILTTDQDLIKNRVQAIPDEFIECFVKNPSCEEIETKLVEQRSHLTLNDWVDEDENGKFPISIAGAFCYRKIYKIILPKEEAKQCCDSGIVDEFCRETLKCKHAIEEPKQETLEEAAEKWYDSTEENKGFPKIKAFIDGAKWQQERSYSEEDIKQAFYADNRVWKNRLQDWEEVDFDKWFEQFKKK